MKVKKKIIYIGITLWLIAFIQMINSSFHQETEEEQIVSAFASNDFLSTVSTVNASGSYGNEYLSADEREEFLLDIAHELGVNNGLVYDSVTEDGVTTSSLVRTGDNTQVVLKLITTETEISSNVINLQHVVRVTLEFDNSLESAFYYKDLLKKALEQAGVNPDISIYLKGNISGALSMNQKNMIADKLIESADGKILTESRQDDLFTVYAYTEHINDYILSGSMKTNLNVIISYDEINDTTEVCMATPLMNEDY